MTKQRERFSSRASPELLEAMREIAQKEGCGFDAELEDAMEQYIGGKRQGEVRPEVMAHFHASVEKHRLLGELLAK